MQQGVKRLLGIHVLINYIRCRLLFAKQLNQRIKPLDHSTFKNMPFVLFARLLGLSNCAENREEHLILRENNL